MTTTARLAPSARCFLSGAAGGCAALVGVRHAEPLDIVVTAP